MCKAGAKEAGAKEAGAKEAGARRRQAGWCAGRGFESSGTGSPRVHLALPLAVASDHVGESRSVVAGTHGRLTRRRWLGAEAILPSGEMLDVIADLDVSKR